MDRSGRLERVLRRMAADGVDTLVALSNARHSMARTDPATHLSGFRSLGESAFVLFGDGTARLVVTPDYDEERARMRRPDTTIVAGDDLAAALAQVLAERGARTGRIATTGLARIRDENSTNGTFVNGDRVLPGIAVRLADGDIVRLAADVSAEVMLPRQQPDPSSLSRPDHR
jgi:hypothetical protein